MENIEDQKSSGLKKLRQIDEEIATYVRTVSKQRWIEIDRHWRVQKEKKTELKQKLQTVLTKEELSILVI